MVRVREWRRRTSTASSSSCSTSGYDRPGLAHVPGVPLSRSSRSRPLPTVELGLIVASPSDGFASAGGSAALGVSDPDSPPRRDALFGADFLGDFFDDFFAAAPDAPDDVPDDDEADDAARDDESLVAEPEVVSAPAVHGVANNTTPTPNAAARPPTRPIPAEAGFCPTPLVEPNTCP